MTGSDASSGPDDEAEPSQPESDTVEVHYRTIRGIIAFARVDPESIDTPEGVEPSIFDIAAAGLGRLLGIADAASMAEISLTLSEAVSDGPNHVQDPIRMTELPRETVEIFDAYFAHFRPGATTSYDGDHDDLMLNPEYSEKFHEAVDTAQQTIGRN